MIKYFLDKYFEKTKGYFPFFKYCPKMYQNYYFNKRAGNILGYEYNWLEPQTYNEKIKWLIHNERLKAKSLLTDKIKMKAYVTALIGEGHCAPIYGIWDKFEDIDFSYLPNLFVLKANHAWAMNMFITNKNFIKENRKSIKKITNDWLKVNFEHFSAEPQYSLIEPKLFAEFYRPARNVYRGDYQVHCINEVPFMIELVHVKDNMGSYRFYDTNWKLLPYSYKVNQTDVVDEKPDFLEEMLEYAKILCKGFSFVRIDFAKSFENLHVGEMTFTPSSCIMPFSDKAFDSELGSVLKLPFEPKENSLDNKEKECTGV